MHQRPNYSFNYDAFIFRLQRRNLPFDLLFFNLNPFQQVLHFGIFGICKPLERSVVFSAVYVDVCLGPKSVIITISHSAS